MAVAESLSAFLKFRFLLMSWNNRLLRLLALLLGSADDVAREEEDEEAVELTLLLLLLLLPAPAPLLCQKARAEGCRRSVFKGDDDESATALVGAPSARLISRRTTMTTREMREGGGCSGIRSCSLPLLQ